MPVLFSFKICLGTVNTVDDGVKWLSYTYLFTRMRKNPHVYGITFPDLEVGFYAAGAITNLRLFFEDLPFVRILRLEEI